MRRFVDICLQVKFVAVEIVSVAVFLGLLAGFLWHEWVRVGQVFFQN